LDPHAPQLADDGLDLGFTARLPEEESPSDPASSDEPVLWLRLVDAALRPRAGLRVELHGAGTRYSAVSEPDGTLWLDGCEPGTYTLSAVPGTATVPTLYLSDLRHDQRPYLVIL
jgi:hypothetical protein